MLKKTSRITSSTDAISSDWVGRWLCFAFPSFEHSLGTTILNCGNRLSWWGDLGKLEKERWKKPQCCDERLFSSIIWVRVGNRCFASLVRLFFCHYYYLTTLSCRNILRADEKPVLGYDIMILSDLLHFSTSHDELISSIQMLLAKLESARIYVGVRPFLLEIRLYHVNWMKITFIRQVLIPGLRSATLSSGRVKKQGYRSQKSSMKASKINGWAIWLSVIWTKRLLEFEKLHVDTGLAAGPQITYNKFCSIERSITIYKIILGRKDCTKRKTDGR